MSGRSPGRGPVMKPDPVKEEAVVFRRPDVGALGDYGGNHGDLSPGSKGADTDFYFGGNGTGIIISARPNCSEDNVVGWGDKIRSSDVSDGLSQTLLLGEMHVSRRQLGLLPNDGPVYCGSEVNYATRVVGPGARLALGPDDESASRYAFGSWHLDVCHFAFGDGGVRPVSVDASTTVLASMGHRKDGNSK